MDNMEYIRLLNSNKFSIKEKKLLFIGILSNTICDKTLFKRNNDLKEYIGLYEELLKIDPYKEYLYGSRILLNSRLVRDFMDIEDNFIIKECFKIHIKFIENSEEFKKEYQKRNDKIKDKRKNVSNDSNLLTDMINKNK